MNLKSIIQAIGRFFEKLFNDTKDAFEELPKEQQDAIIQGVHVAEAIKEFYSKGEQFIVSLIALKANVSDDVARGAILAIGKDLGVDTGQVRDVLDKVANRVEEAVTDNAWNALWQDVAKFATIWLSTGKANWLTLGLGVIEFAYQRFIKGVK